METQNLSGFGIKDCLTEAILGSKRFGTCNKDQEVTLSTIRMLEILFLNRIKEGEELRRTDK